MNDAQTVGSLTFEFLGRGPYAGTTDGRILRHSWPFNSLQDYGYTSPNRYCTFKFHFFLDILYNHSYKKRVKITRT